MAGIRTRFAPSPTGDLHVGGARTALFSWLFARQNQGVFILRIEDTDLERSTQAAADTIIEAMRWLNLDYDEGPFYQSHRFDRYREVIQQLLNEDKAYRCYCTKERLEALREQQMAQGQKPRYDGHCRNLPTQSDQPFVIRFCNPIAGEVTFNDMVRGKITISNQELDDLILVRTDGVPTYNFVVVVDDYDMKITHVIRGDDHINNTPRQINILQALGAPLPEYGHVPTILGSDGKRLSKRHGAAGVLEYREAGFLPQALINYLVRLGWAHKDQEIFSLEEMIKYFDVYNIQRSPAAFNPEKLAWLNQQYLKVLDKNILAPAFSEQLKKRDLDYIHGPSLAEIIGLQAERCKTLAEMAENSRYFFQSEIVYEQTAFAKFLTPDILPLIQKIREKLLAMTTWAIDEIHQLIKEIAAEYQLNLGKVAQPLRVAMTGNTTSPPIDATLFHIGKAKVIQRLDEVIQRMKSGNEGKIN